MMYPILCKIKYETLHHAFAGRAIWVQIGFSIFANWIIAPFLMVCLVDSEDHFCRLLITALASLPYPGRSYQTILVCAKG